MLCVNTEAGHVNMLNFTLYVKIVQLIMRRKRDEHFVSDYNSNMTYGPIFLINQEHNINLYINNFTKILKANVLVRFILA